MQGRSGRVEGLVYRLLSSLPPQLGCYFRGSRGLFTPQRCGFEVGGTPYAIAQFSPDRSWEASSAILCPGGASKAVGDDQGADLFHFIQEEANAQGSPGQQSHRNLVAKLGLEFMSPIPAACNPPIWDLHNWRCDFIQFTPFSPLILSGIPCHRATGKD